MPDSEFLTVEELAEITGYKHPGSQREWLDANGWPYVLGLPGARFSPGAGPMDCAWVLVPGDFGQFFGRQKFGIRHRRRNILQAGEDFTR